MIRGTNLSNVTLMQPDPTHYGIVSEGGIVYTDREMLWGAVVAVGLDRNMDNAFNIQEASNAIAAHQNLNERDREHLRNTLREIWHQAGKDESAELTVVEFALALRLPMPRGPGQRFMGEYLLERNLSLLYHAAHNNQDWALAYAATVKLMQFIN